MFRRAAIVCSSLAWLGCGTQDSAPSPSPSPAIASAIADDLAAMTDYIRKSKSAEAKMNLRRIATSIQAANEELQVGPDGSAQPPVLASAPLTPAAGECCKQPKHRCAPEPGDWKHPAWSAIFFDIADPHYYSYEVVVDATGFVARAVGDLDCDGTLATFELRGTKQPDGTYALAAEPTADAPLE